MYLTVMSLVGLLVLKAMHERLIYQYPYGKEFCQISCVKCVDIGISDLPEIANSYPLCPHLPG